MEIKIENAKAALKTADESVKKVLLALLPELKETEAQTAANRPITERVNGLNKVLKHAIRREAMTVLIKIADRFLKKSDKKSENGSEEGKEADHE